MLQSALQIYERRVRTVLVCSGKLGRIVAVYKNQARMVTGGDGYGGCI